MASRLTNSEGSLWSTQVQVGLWQDGDKEALGRISQRFAPLVRYRIQGHRTWPKLQRLLGLEDVEQELWARVLRSGPAAFVTSGKTGAFVAWLAQIADSTLIDLLRGAEAQKRGGEQSPEFIDSRIEAQKMRRPGQMTLLSPTAEARLGEFEALAGKVLTDREMKAWRWVVLEGYTSGEAAMGLDTTAAAVRSLLVRSRSKLQEILQPPKSSPGTAPPQS
jgi:DNA-directed RNA polymerase specialized sigma24 family protein